jgi:hypothetical protein
VLSAAADHRTRSSSEEEIRSLEAIHHRIGGGEGGEGGGERGERCGSGGSGGGSSGSCEGDGGDAPALGSAGRPLRSSGSTLHCGVRSLRDLRARQGA